MVTNRNVKTLVTPLTSAVVDDTGPASFAAQLSLNSGMVKTAVAECAACLADLFVSTLM